MSRISENTRIGIVDLRASLRSLDPRRSVSAESHLNAAGEPLEEETGTLRWLPQHMRTMVQVGMIDSKVLQGRMVAELPSSI